MSAQAMCGVFPILITPFFEDGRIDEGSLRRLIKFNLDAGVHGLGVALASEIFKLSEGERDEVTRIVVEQVGGRVPVVFNTGAPGTKAQKTAPHSRQPFLIFDFHLSQNTPAGGIRPSRRGWR